MMSQPEDLARRFGSGQSVKRIEDDGLLRGEGRYTDDVVPEGQLSIVFLRSPYPHARIAAIAIDAAQAMPGVALVLTGGQLHDQGLQPLAGTTGFKRPDGNPGVTPARNALAHEHVRYVGEAVAAVVADTVQQAKDAAEAITIDYE